MTELLYQDYKVLVKRLDRLYSDVFDLRKFVETKNEIDLSNKEQIESFYGEHGEEI